MKVVLLCGGYGTRIRDVADNIPKPMIPIGGYPILWHIMKYYAAFGMRDYILCLGYQGHIIKDFFLNYEGRTTDCTVQLGRERKITYHTSHQEEDWRVTLANTGVESMTGARVKKVARYVGNDRHFMLSYGDGVSDVDLRKLLDFHESHGKILTVTGVRPPGRFGEIVADEAGLVRSFNEKPQVTGGRISGGFFVCRRELFDYLGDDEDLIFERGPMEALVKDHEMMVYPHDGFWHPMDTYRDYKFLNELCEDRRAPWMSWG